MNIVFHTNQLSLRGTEVAMYDYAHHNEVLLGNKSIILTKNPSIWRYSNEKAIEKFKNRFDVIFYDNVKQIEEILDAYRADVFYTLKAGYIDDVISKKHKTVVHAVFQYEEPHGNVYAYVSEWLSRLYGYRHPFVPHMIDLPEHNDNMRQELNIPDNAIVYGRYGGYETFDIAYAKEAVKQAAIKKPDLYFLFMNTQRFSDSKYKNIIYLDGTADLYTKVKFINTCDAMIHARHKGESFGLAIGEFSTRNKPILTCRNAIDKAHFDILGNNGIYYNSQSELLNLLINPEFLQKKISWNCYHNYTPEKVMNKFKQIFLS